MLSTALLVAAALVLLVLAVATTKPGQFRIERRTSIRAEAATIYAFLDDFHRWGAWSPWEGLDPSMRRSHSGAPSGVGAAYAWQGNKKVGEGRMEILEAAPPMRVKVKLDFLKPFEAHNTAEFTLAPTGGSTEVVWAMYGPQSFMGKVMTVFVSMDRMVGKDFEKGLENLKRAAEAS